MPRSQPLLYIALSFFLAAGAAAFVLQASIAIRTQAELDYGEGIVLWQAANVTDWKKAYHPVEEYPHIVFHYPPLYHLTSRFVALFTGNLLMAGRLTSILSLAGTCLVAGLLTALVLPPGRGKPAPFIGSLTAGTLVFTTPVWSWACLMRVDALAIFLTICGVALFVLARRRPALAFLSFAFFVAAVYTKQTSIAGPAACLILALIEKPRYAAQLFGFAVSLGLVILLMFYMVTDGLILRHLIVYNQNPYDPAQIPMRLKAHCSKLVGPLFSSAIFPLGLLHGLRGRHLSVCELVRHVLTRSVFERCVVVVGLYFWLTAFIATATISKLGASDNYFLEMDIAACLLSGLFLGWLARRVSFRLRRSYVLLQVVVVFIFLMQATGNWRMLYRTAAAFAHPAADYSSEVVSLLKALPDPIYSEDMVVLMEAGKQIPAEPAIITALALDKKWDESGFVRRIERGEFHAIVISTSLDNRQRFTEPIAAAVQQRYYLGKELGKFHVYLPR